MGHVLMAVNPFEVIPNIYGKEVIQRSPKLPTAPLLHLIIILSCIP
jgi:myosin heavy subunit